MIKITIRSKKNGQTQERELTAEEAKNYLYDISHRVLDINQVFILSTTGLTKDLRDLLSFLSTKYYNLEKQGHYVRVTFNSDVPTKKRTAHVGVSVSSIRNFAKKIENIFPESSVEIQYFSDEFLLRVNYPQSETQLLLYCSYQLEIIKTYAIREDNEFIDVKQSDKMVKQINDLFCKQRYYYKKMLKHGK